MAVKKINRRLNLIIPVENDDGMPLWIHSTPISAEVFDSFFMPLAQTFTAIYGQGLGVLSGPRVADKLLRKVSENLGVWPDVEKGLVADIHRLTNVLIPGEHGWETIPYEEAKKTHLSPEDVSEVNAALIFFTVASTIPRRSETARILEGMELWGAQASSSSFTEWKNSLPTWKKPENTGETPIT